MYVPLISARQRAMRSAVCRVIDSVVYRHIGNEHRIDPLQTPHVVAVLVRERAPPVVGIDAAHAAEVVLGDEGVELVKTQVFFTLHDANGVQRNGRNNRPLAPADGAVTTPGVDDSVKQIQLQHHRAAVAAQPMLGLDDGVTDSMDAHLNLSGQQLRHKDQWVQTPPNAVR